ncbi:MAG TPA: NADH-ubiquinone oxidoreductase-F iron-sulfur binding region domain-containing protein [Candidatus Hydrogenedens sp.]|nr:NADH-ubiquinone oxidoreductase-F iron-sulfur binding region domain-containing protein [Candidatus Hydrogenedens sp.]
MNSINNNYEALFKKAEEFRNSLGYGEKIRIRVGSATCEHAAGSQIVYEEFKKHIASSGKQDIILEKTGCTGRCSCEPIVGVFIPGKLPVKYQLVKRDTVHKIFMEHVIGGKIVQENLLDKTPDSCKYHVLMCDGSGCGGALEGGLRFQFEMKLADSGLKPDEVWLTHIGCLGFCTIREKKEQTVQVMVRPDNVIYKIKTIKDVEDIIENHFKKGKVVQRLVAKERPISQRFYNLYGDVAFFNKQTRIALRNAGVVNPENIYDYIHYKGFLALKEVLEKGDPEWVVKQVTESKLRGRGGGGFPTGMKWASARKAKETIRYIICNADEGDPGAFMDRSMLESDPFSIVEGMIIGGFAIGAQKGYFYIRAEYPLAVERISHAIEECRKHNLLGQNILGSDFSFDLEIRLGAGAFVCGEETALIHSIEGERGQPRVRPPYPTESGLWGKPTVINNVETFANVPPIIVYSPEWFAQVGTSRSGGTKVFALAGKIQRTGFVEVPIGTTLRNIVYGIGGGPAGSKKAKAIQTGGPAGGCIPEKYFDTPVDFDTLGKLGSIMGSGGMIVLDEDDCMVDVAKFYMEFCQDESCGKCTPCREGTKRILEILTKITEGKGTEEDLEKLERLAKLVKKSSLCGLGRAAPNPVLSTLNYFREEYLAHVRDKKCPSKKCRSLIHYEIDPEKCVGCTMCAKNCPVLCITGERKEVHVIDTTRCIKCGRCFEVCRFKAVKKL